MDQMKSPYRLFQKKNGYYFCEHRDTGAQHSLHTKNEAEAALLSEFETATCVSNDT